MRRASLRPPRRKSLLHKRARRRGVRKRTLSGVFPRVTVGRVAAIAARLFSIFSGRLSEQVGPFALFALVCGLVVPGGDLSFRLGPRYKPRKCSVRLGGSKYFFGHRMTTAGCSADGRESDVHEVRIPAAVLFRRPERPFWGRN